LSDIKTSFWTHSCGICPCLNVLNTYLLLLRIFEFIKRIYNRREKARLIFVNSYIILGKIIIKSTNILLLMLLIWSLTTIFWNHSSSMMCWNISLSCKSYYSTCTKHRTYHLIGSTLCWSERLVRIIRGGLLLCNLRDPVWCTVLMLYVFSSWKNWGLLLLRDWLLLLSLALR
jgi:hypothetical protein